MVESSEASAGQAFLVDFEPRGRERRLFQGSKQSIQVYDEVQRFGAECQMAASALGQANRAAMNSATTQIVQRLEIAFP